MNSSNSATPSKGKLWWATFKEKLKSDPELRRIYSERQRINNVAYRKRDPEKQKQRAHRSYLNRKEAHYEWQKRWRISNRLLYLLLKKRRHAREKGALGSYTLQQWQFLKLLYAFTCPVCLRAEPEITLTADHKIPLIAGGTNDISNIQPLCLSCNSRKNRQTWFAISPLCYELATI